MAAAPADTVLAHVAELQRRDEEIAVQIEAVRALEERVGAVRARAGFVGEALERIPLARDEVTRRRRDADAAVETAAAELERASSRLAALESSRRRSTDELERARKEDATAREALSDAAAARARMDEREEALTEEESALRAERGELGRAAVGIASELERIGRVTEAARVAPGETLAELDDWGGRVRSALFVVRGTLEAERERVVVEANALGTSVLGEELGASGVALVRRRLEAALRG